MPQPNRGNSNADIGKQSYAYGSTFALERVPTQYPQPGQLSWSVEAMTRRIEVLLPPDSRTKRVNKKTLRGEGNDS